MVQDPYPISLLVALFMPHLRLSSADVALPLAQDFRLLVAPAAVGSPISKCM